MDINSDLPTRKLAYSWQRTSRNGQHFPLYKDASNFFTPNNETCFYDDQVIMLRERVSTLILCNYPHEINFIN